MSGSLPTVVILHSVFSLPSSIVTMDTMNTTHAHMVNQLFTFTTYREYHSLPRWYCTRACGTYAVHASTTCDISLYVVSNIIKLHLVEAGCSNECPTVYIALYKGRCKTWTLEWTHGLDVN